MIAPLARRVAAVALPLLILLITGPARAQSDNPDLARLKQIQRAQLLKRTRGLLRPGAAQRDDARSRMPREEGDPSASVGEESGRLAGRERPFSATALGPNVRANNRATDTVLCPGPVPCSTQAEESIAAWGQYVLIAWNDAENADPFAHPPPNNDVQGYGFSTDGGVTFTDGGVPPKGFNWTWISDPVVTVNEATGKFYFCALVDSTPGFSGIGIVPATFSGNSLLWGAPVMIRKVSASLLLDKPWVVADSKNDSLYISYTTFTAFGYDHIQFQRSANGVAWTPAVTLSAGADSGYVQGSRPAVGPLGEVYVTWAAIGPIDVDYFRIRKSTNAGGTFAVQVTLPSGGIPASGYYGNWGSGAPGYNRERGVTYPSIAVDRSAGPSRGRVYVTWNESINFYDDWLNAGPGAKSEPPGEAGANETTASATPFTVNNIVRGAVGSSADFDYWGFSATQGQTGVFFVDSLGFSLDVAFRLFCSDGVTRLGFSNFGVGGGALIVFTFPETGTYYLRCAGFDGTTGAYRIHTKFSVPGPERARDHRDVFITSSSNGTSWTTPLRVNQDAGRYDNWLPEVGVGADGTLSVLWYDWRDSPAGRCGGLSHVYLAQSVNGGTSWSAGAVTTAASDWTHSASYLAPNQGDYLGLYVSPSALHLAWADVRDGDPDVYTSHVPLLVTPVQASLVSAIAAPDRVTLTWYAPGAEALSAGIYRRTSSTDWIPLGQVDVPANARIVFADRTVTPGTRYQYRCGVVEHGAESFFGETSVLVPSFVLAISAVAPNPASRDLSVSFTLPSAAPATLRLIDIAGRELRRREVGSVAGPQRVNLAEGRALPMGIYLIELTQGGRSITARASVVR